MDIETRLELLKIANLIHEGGQTAAETVKSAKVLEAYIRSPVKAGDGGSGDAD